MLTLDKTLDTIALMCKSLKSVGRAFLKVIQVFSTVRTVLYIGCSGPMIGCSCTQSSGLDKRELYAYVACCPCYDLSQHMCFGVLVAFSTNEDPDKPVQTRISLCY